jgi:hypothetical protein
MIKFISLGNLGRLGNQMFQVASTIGIAERNKTLAVFNHWEYLKYFDNELTIHNYPGAIFIKEKNFHHDDYKLCGEHDYSLHGYFQSYKYFSKDFKFKFKDDLKQKCLSLLPQNGKENIAIHIRRGDYVGNPSHYNLSIRYYLNALDAFGDLDKYNLCFFSDDIEYAKWHFESLPNSYFIQGSEIEDLCCMSLCDHFIIANSSFSWWGCFIGKTEKSIIVRPKEHFAGNQLKHDIKDLYPEEWIVVSDETKVVLLDTTFIIPVSYDHNDRMANLNLSVQHIQTNFNTNISVIEQGGTKFNYVEDYCDYAFYKSEQFHRTRMINKIAKFVITDYVVNWDADMILNPVKIWQSVKLLRANIDVVYPYDGNFKHIDRTKHRYLATNLDWLIGKELNGPIESWGGAIFLNRKRFLSVGGENEKFVSWGPEDAERYVRFLKMGLLVTRIIGPIYHLEHYRGKNSGRHNPYLEANRKEWHMIRVMEPEALKEYIKTWPWM